MFTHRMLFSREKPLVKSSGPGSIFYHIALRCIFIRVFSDLLFQKHKNTLLHFFFIYFISCFYNIYLSQLIQINLSFYRGGNDNPSYALGCEDLFFVCRYRLHSVACFSYWFDNCGFFTEGNTYRRSAASSLPLWGNTDVASSRISTLVDRNQKHLVTRLM